MDELTRTLQRETGRFVEKVLEADRKLGLIMAEAEAKGDVALAAKVAAAQRGLTAMVEETLLEVVAVQGEWPS